MNTNEPTLRDLLDDSKEAASGPGRYCDRMAYVIDVACDANGDESLSLGLGGTYHSRFGRRILTVTSDGFVRTARYPSANAAAHALDTIRRWYAGEDIAGIEQDA